MKRVWIIVFLLSVAGCDKVNIGWLQRDSGQTSVSDPSPSDVVSPEPVDIEPVAVVDRPEANRGVLGTTVASLGAATEPGMWLKTPLVAKTRPGTVRWSGKTASVTLIPIEGESGAGSRISLQAMQALGMPLTDLSEVQVSAE
ncbi:hypothetical protein [Shimia sp.]|uniref:hypothetical protein n=1 Tax=Shimia sp. TaxID=1954381 RepID=UPI003299ACDF